MSQSSAQSRGQGSYTSSAHPEGPLSRESSRASKKAVTYKDAYIAALRVAYLHYLLQPRSKRTRHLPPQRPPLSRSAGSFQDLIKDFTIVRDSKSTRLPHGFVAELEKRLAGIVMGKEKRPEYQDSVVKRTFAGFFNALSEQTFKKQMEKDRRVEDLVLIYFSTATKELQKGKPPGDDSVKLMVDRHVALFVRLLSLILKDGDWTKSLPELMTKLTTLESKLLAHDQDLSNLQGNATGNTVEEVVPLSYEVKDMPQVQVVARIFGLTNTMAQSDITKNRPLWTEKAALQDLKTYQAHLNLGTSHTLNGNDFDLYETYEIWKKSEAPELSQMMLAIFRAIPELAKKSTSNTLPQFQTSGSGLTSSHSSHSELSKALSLHTDGSAHSMEQLADLGSLHLGDEQAIEHHDTGESVYIFIPWDPRATYRFIMLQAISHDLNPQDSDVPPPTLLSQKSLDLLNEIASRWRLPSFSRTVLFLDVVREKFVNHEMTLDQLDAAFNVAKDSSHDEKKDTRSIGLSLAERRQWTISDFVLMQQLVATLHEVLLRDLYTTFMQCYDNKAPPTLGSILYVMDNHIRSDPSFQQPSDPYSNFKEQVTAGLSQKAREMYGELVDQVIPQEQDAWSFYNVSQLGQNVLRLGEKMQKRYKKTPEVFGINLLFILLSCVLPAYAEDSGAIIERIIQGAKERNEEVPIQDGLELYEHMKNFRRVHADALPNVPFAFNIEDTLADFVWRWIFATEHQIPGWVENAIKQDDFIIKMANGQSPPPADERQSVSIIDTFRSFNQILDQIFRLGWDDDLGYAKFMTSLSKSLGSGVSRYCEVVEQMFSKEMDRLSPEQEAAANKTRQEKWMQLAKDTWHNKEKIEPFQFYPRSLIKLNNIAFALKQWDQLEKEINVDICAEVIQRHAPPVTQRQRRITHYVFTIKVVEAEDLKACDVSGYSDPYVVLTDEYQKRLSKTRIIYQNLNPRWDESIDITTQGALNVVATIWDWDAMGDHDYVGRTTLKLDPSHFGDFLPREYWLDLDTQGRLLVRVSMEGERDDIQFYFGKAFRTLKRTERDMTRKITDKLSAYISHCLSRRALRSLLSRGMTMSSVSSYFSRARTSAALPVIAAAETDVTNALKPLFTYFDDNFAIINQTLTSESMIAVMTRLWKEVLITIEGLLVPPLSDKPSQQRQLTQQELDVVFKWLQLLFDFFHAVDESTGKAEGVSTHILKSPKYHEIQTLNFFYFETTENLIRTSERMVSANVARQQANRGRLSAPPTFGAGFGGQGGLMGMPSTRRAKSIMLSRNLGTMKKAKEEKWKEAQAEPSDDMIMRILRMRPEAVSYLRDRSRQKERLAAAAAADTIVRQSLLAGSGGRMAATLGRR